MYTGNLDKILGLAYAKAFIHNHGDATVSGFNSALGDIIDVVIHKNKVGSLMLINIRPQSSKKKPKSKVSFWLY